MSTGLTALVLLRLDARTGQWVSVADLARMVHMPEERLRAHMEEHMCDGLYAGFCLAREAGVISSVRVLHEHSVA